ncbi:hypothetical protein SAMN05428949_1098 [Chitinophaga sp. YR627]|uniref:hypothetical protein n=1 Tax=Chitinophaga sp. YR627 TaxID=1881041 RepID=UPI0008E55336|nr:hypothetical protein [Chitinophaga sp. YR627]SFM86613.1 hypothetical protein SAMN05428949_1098 [Chitinophaga sp. YR627]
MRNLILFFALFLFSCRKYEARLEQQNLSSGIVRVTQNGSVGVNGAKIGEMVTVYAKVGEPGAALQFFAGGVAADVISHGSRQIIVQPEAGGQTAALPVDTFDIQISSTAKIGPGTLYFSLDGKSSAALPFEIFRPDILVPGKSFVDPFLYTYMDSVRQGDGSYSYMLPNELRDGMVGQAVINQVSSLAYDANGNTFYFIDRQPDDNSYRIRQLRQGQVTTIAGGGNNYMATTAAQLKLSAIEDLQPGPDGWLYFSSKFYTDPDPVTGFTARHALIERLQPATGVVEILVGGKRVIEKYYSRPYDDYTGIEDGSRDSAMVIYPQSFTFDKQGNLYFLDGTAEYAGSGTLLRRLNRDGTLETVLGKIGKEVYDYEDVDGVLYKVPFYYSLDEHMDGFGDAVRLSGASGLVLAGNGKLYIPCSGAGWRQNIVEVNPETLEAATIVGMPEGQQSSLRTGTFREVDLGGITSFDVDFDGNILFGQNIIYKMNLQEETIAKLAGGGTYGGDLRALVKQRQSGENANLTGRLNKIVFDQFGNLYVGFDYNIPPTDMKISKIVIEH